VQADHLLDVFEERAAKAMERATTAEEKVTRLTERLEASEDEGRETAARLLAVETEVKQTEVRARSAEEQAAELGERLQAAEQRATEASERMLAAQAQAKQADLRMRAAEDKAKDAIKRMKTAEDEAGRATAGALVAETKVKQGEVRARAVEDQSAEIAAKNAQLLEQLQQARGELIGFEERVRLSEERAETAEERVGVMEAQMKELKVRLTVAKAELPTGAVPATERSALQEAVAAEVRRPLTSILGVSLALKHSDPGSRDGQELVKQLATNARKLDRMVGVLTELDRLEDGSLRPYRRRTDLQALTRRVIEESPDMANRNVQIEAEKIVVAVDPSMTEQIIDNLLSNASGRTSSGDPVWVSVAADPEGAVIAVDDAERLTDELRNALSDAEERTDEATRARLPHSLMVLQRLATVHGGRVWVAGREGGGASFRVLLPDTTDEEIQDAAQQADDSGAVVAG
jgi:K+-sensing histidine kinase KdpD